MHAGNGRKQRKTRGRVSERHQTHRCVCVFRLLAFLSFFALFSPVTNMRRLAHLLTLLQNNCMSTLEGRGFELLLSTSGLSPDSLQRNKVHRARKAYVRSARCNSKKNLVRQRKKARMVVIRICGATRFESSCMVRFQYLF